MFWLDMLLTFIFMILIMIIRALFKMSKQIGRLQGEVRELEREIHIRKD